MRYRLYIILILFITLLTGCTNSVTVTAKDSSVSPAGAIIVPNPAEAAGASSLAGTTVVSNPAVTTGISSPTETASVSNPIKVADAQVVDGPNQSIPGGFIPNEAAIEKVPKVQNITISAIGDILVHQNCLEYVWNGDKYDFDPAFSEVMPLLQASDLAIGNLETTISGESAIYGVLSGYNGYPRFNTPDSLLDTLKKSGLDVLITANNHCNDRGKAGFIRTLDQLDERGFLHTGTYRTKEDSEKILVTDVKGIKIAILAYSYSTNGLPVEESWMVNLLKLDKMLDGVKKAKELKPDVIITYLHWGDEYVRQPNNLQKTIADKLIKAGVDIILGDHPHVVEPMEHKTVIDDSGQERQGLVIYSLGNFISGAKGIYRDFAVIFNVGIEKDMETGKISIKEPQPIPTWVQFYNKEGKDTYRVMPIASAIEKYQNKQDSYITEKDFNYIKDKLAEMLEHIKNGPAD